VLLEYALGETNSFLFFITKTGFTSYFLPKRSDIEKKALELRNLMIARSVSEIEPDFAARVQSADKEYPKAAAELSEMLLKPVEDRLRNQRIIIVADGALQYIPFEALPTPQTARTSTPAELIIAHEIGYLPSASSLAIIRQEESRREKADRTIAVFADPVFGLDDARLTKQSNLAPKMTMKSGPAVGRTPAVDNIRPIATGPALQRLDFTAIEADAIQTFVPDPKLRLTMAGFQATRAAAMGPEIAHYKYLHFATHTVLNDQYPELSSLMLSQFDEKGTPQNGALRLRDIYNLRLSANLVVLSACETALGKDVKGEGLMSMVRGFMYSGTPRVLASLWKVDDKATAEFMTEFYRELFQNHSSASKALRQAQLQQMKRKIRNRPFYWAAFQLQGDWK